MEILALVVAIVAIAFIYETDAQVDKLRQRVAALENEVDTLETELGALTSDGEHRRAREHFGKPPAEFGG